ncbi:alpha/beta hydrolase [candidate division KSB1 bacterium]|nr:alpha/beta hydrolase [candidate division KSB1 bacterium]
MILFSVKTLKIIFLILLLITSTITIAQSSNQKSKTDQDYPEVSLINTEKRTFHSNIIKNDFELHISLPFSYSASDTTYPVLFSLDANVKFAMVSTIVNNLGTLTKEIPEIVVVGIAYPLKGLEDWVIGRNRDLTPTKVAETEEYWIKRLSRLTGRNDIDVTTGGADNFIAFIQDELIPFIELNYRVSTTDRTLHGTSLGGLFTLYTLLKSPEIFNRYFASSPSIDWDESFMFQLENDFALSHKDLPVKLFMCVGGLESEYYLTNTKKMDELLSSRNYPNFKIETHVFENETHGTTVSASMGRGLKILFNK